MVRAISYTVHGLVPASCVFADRYNREEVVRSLGNEINLNPPLLLSQLPDIPEELLKLDQVRRDPTHGNTGNDTATLTQHQRRYTATHGDAQTASANQFTFDRVICFSNARKQYLSECHCILCLA